MISRKIEEKCITKAAGLINGADKILVVTHMAPDGDAIGSSLAAMHVLSAIGKDVKILTPDAFLANLQCLPGAKEIVDGTRYPDFAVKLFEDSDLIMCLDFNEPSRTGRLEKLLRESKKPKILIDHHLHPDIDAEVVISHPELAATAYLMFRFFCRMELFNMIDRAAAQCLLAGIMTDTGNLAYNCDDPELYIVISELLRKGADKEELYRRLFNTQSENCMRLNAYAISEKMKVYKDYGCALITLTRAELNRFHYVKGDTEGLVNRPLAIPGVHFSVFMREESELIRVSMRSVGRFPVNELCCAYYDGGGHLNAAGGDFRNGTMAEAIKAFEELLPDIRKKYKDILEKR